MYKNIYYIVQGLPTVEPDMKTVSGTWAQLPRYSMEPSGSAMGDHAWWRDGGRGREGGGGGFVGARKKKKKNGDNVRHPGLQESQSAREERSVW